MDIAEHFPFNFPRVIKHRDNFGILLNRFGLLDTAVEVGVWKGNFAKILRSKWKGDKLILVDPWKQQLDYHDVVVKNWETVYQNVCKRFGANKGVKILRATSCQAAKILGNDLDFVYLDADHSYKHVRQDLQLWWPKIKTGGVLAGHDLFFPARIGLTNALIEFALDRQLTISIVDDHPRYIDSWYVQKSRKAQR